MNDSPHNYSELLELAVLDAHGLLDPIESELFNRSFHNAPASVQDEIVRLQHRLATNESLLPSDLPPASLKGKVIDAVAKAADNEAKRLAPLALIGARVGAARGNINTTGSVVMWRTAAMILFGATVVLAILSFDSHRTATDLSQQIRELQTRVSLHEDGKPGLEVVLTNPLSRGVWLKREDGKNVSSRIFVAFYSNQNDPADPNGEDLGEMVLGHALAFRLEDGVEVELCGLTENGEEIPLARLSADRPLDLQEITNVTKDEYKNLVIFGVDAKTGARWI